jgi:3-hydroxyisobutyrate dehydrogenase-like beta-hydroxyacid dehydrogenase
MSSTMTSRKVALLGTGIMGRHMARRLAAAEFAVTAWNRTPGKAEPLADHGVCIAASPSAAAANADVVIVMVSNGPAVEDVLFSPDDSGRKPAEAMAPGSVLVVMSSIPVETCQDQAPRLAARQVHYVDAPVSGGEPGARDGTLVILAGGEEAVVDGLRDVFAPLGRMTRIGPVGTGQMAKLANQIIVGGTMVAVAEALHFVACGGADPAAVRRALMGGFADSKILDLHGQRMVERNFVPGGPAHYELKDLRTAQAFAGTMGLHFTLLDTLAGIYGQLIEREGTGLDVAGVLIEVERRSQGSPAKSFAGAPATSREDVR